MSSQLVEFAWFEWRVNASFHGTPPDALPTRPPVWFWLEELGFACNEAPSLHATLYDLPRTNQAAVSTLGAEAPLPTYPRAWRYRFPANHWKLRPTRREESRRWLKPQAARTFGSRA